MDTIVFILFLVVLVLILPWVFLARSNRNRKRDVEKTQSQVQDLTARVFALETALKDLRRRRETEAPAATYPVVWERTAPGASSSETPTAAQPTPPTPVVTPPAAAIPPPAATRPTTPSAPPPGPPKLHPPQPPTQTPPLLFTAARSAKAGPSWAAQLKSSLDFEEILGTNWLNKLGIVILVLGVAFFLAYQIRTLGPAGKVLVGFVTGAVLLGAGVWAERHDRYRILARAGIGGGWALIFFTTYAMYHVPAAQVLTSQATDLILMLAVAAVMVVHTLRYDSQAVTGIAFLLAFLTVTVNHSNVYSLAAGVVLAAALVVIVRRKQWFELELMGIAASYLNHYLWLRPIIEPMHGKHHPFPEFASSAGILFAYWAIFRASYVLRSPSAENQERISTGAAVANTALLLALLKYQSVHPEWSFWVLLAVGGIETLLGQFIVAKKRRDAVIVLTTMGLALLIAAFPFRYSHERLSVLWLIEAEALLLIGVWTKDVIFRRFGMLASVVVSIQMIGSDAARVFGRRMDDADVSADFRAAIIFVVAAAVFYLSAHWVLRRWPDLFKNEFDALVMRRLSYAAMIMIGIAAWIVFPESWTAVAWCALAVAIAIAARRLRALDLTYQAIFLTAISTIRVLSINIEDTHKFHGISLRLITVSLVTLLLYGIARWISVGDKKLKTAKNTYTWEQVIRASNTWVAAFLLTLLAWYELRPVGVADAWVIGGLIWLEIGLTRNNLNLRLQGYTAFAASFTRIYFVNLNAAGNPGEISPRFYTIVPLALAFFYAYWRLYEIRAADSPTVTKHSVLAPGERRFKSPEFCCWLGTISFASLVRFELPADWVAAGWAAFVFALLAIAWMSKRRTFLHQGMLIAVGVLFRASMHNLYERSYFPAPALERPWITAGAAIALLLASLPFAFKLREKGRERKAGLAGLLQAIARRPEQIIFFIAIGLLTAVLANEMERGMVTLSWGIEGVAVFLLALKVGERSFRLTGLGLLLLCVGKILAVDVWRLGPRDRYLTFIVLGAALLLVSFLYTRNKEALRQYL